MEHQDKPVHGIAHGASHVEGAAGRLLEREPPEGYRLEWTRHLAREKVSSAAQLRSVVVFRMRDSFLAIPTSLVDVVAEDAAFHSIPPRRSGIPVTIANVRGELVVCVSLSALLGIESTQASAASNGNHYTHLISCRWNDQRFAFPVDEICGVEHYPADKISEIPATLAGSVRNYTRGLISIRDRTIALVDEELLFEAWSKSLL